MAKNDHSARGGLTVALRLLEILRKIQTASPASRITADSIWKSMCEGGTVDEIVGLRAVQEYLKVISETPELGVKRLGSQHDGGYYYVWDPTVENDKNILTPESALALCLVEAHMKHFLPEKEQRRLKRLFEHAADVLKRKNQKNKYEDLLKRIEVVPRGFSLIPPQVDARILEKIMQAVMEKKRIRVEYKGRKDKSARKRHLEPVGIVERSGVFYVVARDVDAPKRPAEDDFATVDAGNSAANASGRYRVNRDYKSWAVHRISGVELDDEFNYPKSANFNLKEHVQLGYLGGIQSESPMKVVLRFKGDSGKHLGNGESRLSDSHKVVEETDEHMVIECKIVDTDEFRRWILERGATCEVLEPRELRKEIRKELEAALENYRTGK